MGDDPAAVSGPHTDGGEGDGADAELSDHLFGRLHHAVFGFGAALALSPALRDEGHAGSDDQNDTRASAPARPSFSVIHQWPRPGRSATRAPARTAARRR